MDKSITFNIDQTLVYKLILYDFKSIKSCYCKKANCSQPITIVNERKNFDLYLKFKISTVIGKLKKYVSCKFGRNPTLSPIAIVMYVHYI